MLSITDLCPELPTKTVRIRGKDIVVTSISMSDEQALERQQPEPRPDSSMSPTEAAQEMGRERFRYRMTQWRARRRAALACMSAGIGNGDGEGWEPGRSAEWVSAWIDEIVGKMASEEVIILYTAQSSILAESMAPDAERIGDGDNAGNSSGRSGGGDTDSDGNSQVNTA